MFCLLLEVTNCDLKFCDSLDNWISQFVISSYAFVLLETFNTTPIAANEIASEVPP